MPLEVSESSWRRPPLHDEDRLPHLGTGDTHTEWKMDHATSVQVLRLRRKEQWAEDYRKRAIERGDIRRAIRATNFLMAVSARGDGIALAEISTFRS